MFNKMKAGMIGFVVALLMLISTCVNAEDNFVAAEIETNVAEFVKVVFGSSPPTLGDYFKFSSIHAEEEYVLEEQNCKRMFKGKAQDVDQRCTRYIDYRNKNSRKVESLYFKLLRKKLRIPPSHLHVGKVEKQADGGYCANAQVAGSETQLTICHASTRTLAELGLVDVIKVNGDATEKFLRGKIGSESRGLGSK